MPRPKRLDQATIQDSFTPPSSLDAGQHIARVDRAAGNNLYNVELPPDQAQEAILVEMPAKFRSTMWLKRGGFVLVELKEGREGERDNKIAGEIINVVGDEKAWRKMPWWPSAFPKKRDTEEDDDDMMPPSEESDEEV